RHPPLRPLPTQARRPSADRAVGARRRGGGCAVSGARVALVADERAFALGVRLAFVFRALKLLGFPGVLGRGVMRGGLDLARLGELAAGLVVAAAGFVVAFALDLIVGWCGRAHAVLPVGERWSVRFASGSGRDPRRVGHLFGDDVEADKRARA